MPPFLYETKAASHAAHIDERGISCCRFSYSRKRAAASAYKKKQQHKMPLSSQRETEVSDAVFDYRRNGSMTCRIMSLRGTSA